MGNDTQQLADVTAASVSGDPNSYQFSVTISSPDTGCDQYANWWEILTVDGSLIYRRILLHSHVDEQPFTRSGGPVAIEANQIVLIRAHLNKKGYGGKALRGTAENGFEEFKLPVDFASDLETQEPLPGDCPG